MAFTVTFPSSGPVPQPADAAAWLTERGEPFELEGPTTIALRALPVRLVMAPDQSAMKAHIEVTSSCPLSRMVDMLFALSVRAGADVFLAGTGQVTRAALWLSLADEQDRKRLAESLVRAKEHGASAQIHKRLWALVAALRPGHDDRWDAQRQAVVELREVGGEGGLSVEEAKWHTANPEPGDVVAVPVRGFLHTMAWRWLSEAYPGIAEAEHTLH